MRTGRPKLAIHKRRTRYVQVRLTEREFRRLKKDALYHKMSVSSYIRSILNLD